MMRRQGIFDQIRSDFRTGSVLTRLIMANLIVFAIVLVWALIAQLMKLDALLIQGMPSMAWWMATTADLGTLLHKPWSVFTYMFLHVGFFHILMNMLVLYFSGKIFEQLMGGKRILSTYILGGLLGAVLHIAASNIFPLLRDAMPPGGISTLGASGSVMAVFVAAASYAPNLRVLLFGIFPVQLKWIAIIYVGLDIFSLTAQDGVAHFAHLGGALWGFAMGRQLLKGKYIAKWFDRLVENIVSIFKSGRRMKVKYKARKKQPYDQPEYHRMSDEDYAAEKKRRQQEIDNILDKISKSGYDSLSKKEKEILFRASNDR